MSHSTPRPRRIASHYVLYRRSLLRNAIVSLSSDGTVEDITTCEDIDSQAGVEFHNGILMPDLVDAHCHLELSHLTGAIPAGGGFVAFADAIGDVRDAVPLEQKLRDIATQDAILWHQGVGFVGDVCNGATTFATKRAGAIDYTSFLETFGIGVDTTDKWLPVAREAARDGIPFVLTPHSTYLLGEELFRRTVEGFDGMGYRGPLSIHFMESTDEEALFRREGKMAPWYEGRWGDADFVGKYPSPAARIVASVPADRDILLIHNCFVTEEEVDMIQAHFTSGRVTWVLCPRSNRYISGIRPPVDMLRRKGVRIAIGTDSLASNTSLDMAAELAMFPSVPLEELLTWATLGGAEGLRARDRAGEFVVGRKSGVVLLTGVDWDNMTLRDDAKTVRII